MKTLETIMTKHYTRAMNTLGVVLMLGVIPMAQAQDIILDNGGTQFSTFGTWPVSTSTAGFYGSNYQTHAANSPAPNAVVVDNTDAGFGATGTWTVSTSVGGFYGSNFQTHAANGDEPSAIILDTPQGQAVGTWGASTGAPGYYGSNYLYHAAGTGTNSFTWSTAVTTGSYNVYVRWTAGTNRATNATYTVTDSSGAHTVTVNQQTNGGSWQLLGSYAFGTTASVTLTDQANGYVIADAIKIVPPGAAPNTATWAPGITTPGSYNVYARWTAASNRASNATYTVTDTTGSHPVSVNQQSNGGTWNLLGTFNLDANSQVSLTDQANGYVIADALEFVPAGQPQVNTATWTPNASPGSYQVYAWWTAGGNRATNATYTITDTTGSHPVSVNQQANGGTWNLLGTFSLNAASTIVLTDQANGYVIADAIRLTPVNLQPVAYYIQTDQLDTPREITDTSGNVVWQWDNSDPFGNNVANENPAGQGQFTCNLRYPGQYFDKETNLAYNVNRDYDPAIGRYLQSDPIGLLGGVNTYTYVDGNPLSKIDPLGLSGTYRIVPWWWPPAMNSSGGNGSNSDSTGNSDIDAGLPGNTSSSSSTASSSNSSSCPKDNSKCTDRWEKEHSECGRKWAGFGQQWVRACQDRANYRLRLCIRNGGEPDPDEPEVWRPD